MNISLAVEVLGIFENLVSYEVWCYTKKVDRRKEKGYNKSKQAKRKTSRRKKQ